MSAGARRASPPAARSADPRKHHRDGDGRARRETAPITRPQIKPVRPKNASQAKARAKARKAKAPKVVRPPLRERLLARISEIDLNPRTLAARVPFVVLVIGSLGLGLGVTLWLSTDAAERSYQLGSARETNQALLQQKEALERDVLEAQAAPALAESARELGMIPSRDTAHLVQDPAGNWIVVGTPKPAEGVPPPPLNTPLPDDTPRAAGTGRREPACTAGGRRPSRDGRPGAGTGEPRSARAPTAPVAPDPAAVPLAVPLPDSPHGTSGQPPALGPAEPPADPLAAPLPHCRPLRTADRPPPRLRPRSSSVRSPRPSPAPRREPRQRSARPQEAAAQARPGPGAVRPRATHPPAGDRHRFAQCVIRVPASDRQRRHLPGAHRRCGAAVQPAGAARRGAARRGGGSAQGHRRRQGRARQHRRPQQRQAGVHHRGARADLSAGQDPQAARRRQAEDARGTRPRGAGCATSPPRWRRG